MKAFLIVLDSVGIGAAPDAADYGDAGAATLPHLCAAVGGLSLPALQALGLGNIPGILPGGLPLAGVPPAAAPGASWGALQEVSQGKDTVTGHWEMAGLEMNPGFALFPPEPPSFPPALIGEFERRTGRKVIGNRAANGVAIMNELGPEHLHTGAWIVYTSADSVFQICAHEETIPLPELYRGCGIARELCDPYRVGRVIARPFTGPAGAFRRTENRRDFAYRAAEPTVLERLAEAGVPVWAVGKIEDIFARRGIAESNHTGNNRDTQRVVAAFAARPGNAFVFANCIDFDMLYGHMRDAAGYARELARTDDWLGAFLPRLGPEDLLLITADHGNDPTFRGNDHTREFVPLLAWRPGRAGRALGIRKGYFDIAQTLASFFGLPPLPRGRSFLD